MRLVLHIGTPKTGTTAVQTYLDEISKLPGGPLYPTTGLVRRDAYGARHKGLTHAGHFNRLRWRSLRRELQESNAPVAVISCEGFWTYPQRARSLSRRLSDFDVDVVVSLRRQDRFFASLLLQERAQFRRTLTAEAFYLERCGDLQYLRNLRFWRKAFGRNAIKPYLYDEQAKDVVPTFATVAGLEKFLHRVDRTAYLNKNPTPVGWSTRDVLGASLAERILLENEAANQKMFKKYFAGATGWPA